jgi:FkbM family methyltransferase
MQAKAVVRSLLSRRVKPHRVMGGAIKGARIVTSWHDYPGGIRGTTEGPLMAWFAASVVRGETWLDVGAHYGYTAIGLCRLVGSNGRVYAFEPVVSTAGHLARTRALNHLSNLSVVPLALGDGRLREVQVPFLRGMAAPGAAGAADGSMFVIGLDEFWPMVTGEAPIHGVKIDVQGMELDCLRGMRETLARWRPKLVVEVHPGVDRVELRRVVEAAGYRPGGVPIDPAPGDGPAAFLDDHSYVFEPSTDA